LPACPACLLQAGMQVRILFIFYASRLFILSIPIHRDKFLSGRQLVALIQNISWQIPAFAGMIPLFNN
jgi:hypothetical protein